MVAYLTSVAAPAGQTFIGWRTCARVCKCVCGISY